MSNGIFVDGSQELLASAFKQPEELGRIAPDGSVTLNWNVIAACAQNWKSGVLDNSGFAKLLLAARATQPAQAAQSDWSTQRFNAPVYPPDGTESPFTVINLGSGKVQMGDSIHDGRLPALWFGINGQGMGHEETMNREARPGETLAVVTFANVEGLDVLLDVIQRIRREKFPEAQAAQGEPAEHWHRLYLEKCQQYNDRVAQLGGVIEALDAEAAQGAGEVVAWQASDGGSSYISNEARSRNSAFRELYTIPLYTQPAAGADVLDAERYRWLRAQDNEDFAFAVVKNPHFDVYESPEELDAHIDAAIAASGRKS